MLAGPPAVTLRQPRLPRRRLAFTVGGARLQRPPSPPPPHARRLAISPERPRPPGGWPRRPDAPAVDHDGPGVHGVERLHLLQELEHPDGGEGHSEVGPAGEVQLGHQPRGFAAIRELLPGHRGVSGGRPGPPAPWAARGGRAGRGPSTAAGCPSRERPMLAAGSGHAPRCVGARSGGLWADGHVAEPASDS